MAAARTAPSVGAINLFDDHSYAGGLFVPDGDYIVLDMNIIMFGGFKQQTGAQRLGVMVDYTPLNEPKPDEPLKSFYSMGTKADQSFAPNPETGKSLVAIPGAQGGSLQQGTNWDEFRKSWIQSGLPAGIATNDLTPLVGAWVHVTNMDEPAERANFRSATAEVTSAGPQRTNKIAVVTEIKEGGAPWEGGGGVPTAGKAGAAVRKTSAVGPTTAAKNITPIKPAVIPATQVSDAGADDVKDLAADCITDVLTANPNGYPRLKLQNDVFKIASKKADEATASQIMDVYFKGPNAADNLSILVGELGFQVAGASVKPA